MGDLYANALAAYFRDVDAVEAAVGETHKSAITSECVMTMDELKLAGAFDAEASDEQTVSMQPARSYLYFLGKVLRRMPSTWDLMRHVISNSLTLRSLPASWAHA